MKKAILGALFVGAMFASCSSDEPIISGGPDDVDNSEGSYITFNIVSPSVNPGSRADTSDDSDKFEPGVGFENEAETALFLFFDGDGKSTQLPQYVNNLQWETTADNNHDKCSKTTVVIAGNTKPTKVVVVLNPPADYSFVSGQTLQGVLARTNNYMLETVSEDSRITMTNSVYVDNNKVVNAVDITGKTYATRGDANKNPVDIYVERVLAKVRTKVVPSGNKFEQGAEIIIDGESKTLTQEIKGIEIANIASKVRLIKNIDGWDREGSKWSDLWPQWNDPTNHRSYWANTDNNNEGFVNQTWNKIADTKYDEEHEFYIHPNTQIGTRTSVLITAVLKDGENTVKDFIWWGGNYYFMGDDPDEITDAKSYKGFLTQYANFVKNEGYRLKYTNSSGEAVYESIDPTMFRWLDKEEHEALMKQITNPFKEYQFTAYLHAAQIPVGCTIVKENAGVKENASEQDKYQKYTNNQEAIDEINNKLKDDKYRVRYWKDGKCYYFANIEHFGPSTTTKDDGTVAPLDVDFGLGVVRNHVYDLTLESVKGVGTPVYDPTVKIIPEKPDDKLWYMGAKIHILKWRLVKQSVNFE